MKTALSASTFSTRRVSNERVWRTRSCVPRFRGILLELYPTLKPMRLRKLQGKLKVEHAILDGLRIFLEKLLADNPDVRSVIPGVIRPVRDAKGPAKVHVTVPTANGWKAIGLSDGARQELFISTSLAKEDLERAIRHASGSSR